MTKSRGLFTLLLVVATFTLGAQKYFVYVTSESEDEVSVVSFDGEKAQVEKVISVGYNPTEIEGPHGITVSPDGKNWFLSMAHGIPYGKLYKFETGEDKLLAQTELGLFPASMQISNATGFLYVVNFNLHGRMVPSSVSVVDIESMTELKQITTGAMPHGSRISPDGKRQYSVAMMSGELFEISTLDLEVSRKLLVDADMEGANDTEEVNGSEHEGHEGELMVHSTVKPTWVMPHPTLNRLYIAGNGSNELIEVDADKWTVTHRLPTGKGPYNIDVSPDGDKVVVTYKSEGKTGIWDAETRTEIAVVENSRRVSHGVAISPDSRYAFISVEGVGGEPGSVDVIDLQSLKRVGVAEVGKQAGGIAFWKIAN